LSVSSHLNVFFYDNTRIYIKSLLSICPSGLRSQCVLLYDYRRNKACYYSYYLLLKYVLTVSIVECISASKNSCEFLYFVRVIYKISIVIVCLSPQISMCSSMITEETTIVSIRRYKKHLKSPFAWTIKTVHLQIIVRRSYRSLVFIFQYSAGCGLLHLSMNHMTWPYYLALL